MVLLDVLDENGNPTGDKLSKQELHDKGLWHAASHIWIYDSGGNIILQKRALVKDSHAGLFDISAAGHIDSGEQPDFSACRELQEELGISVKQGDLEKIGVKKVAGYIEDADWHNKEFYHVYLYKYDGDIDNLKLQEIEVDELIKIAPEDMLKELRDKKLFSKYVPHPLDYYEWICQEVKKRV